MAYDKVVDSAKLDSDLKSVADSIRAKTGTTDELDFPLGFKSAVDGIPTGVPINNQNKTITQNGTYTADEGFTGLGTVSVNVARDDQADIEEQWKRAIVRNYSDKITTLPSGLTSIGDYAFYYCANLVLTSLPEELTFIGLYAFDSCTGLKLTSLPKGLTDVRMCAFSNCTGLNTITFKGKPRSINSYAFNNCINLRTINVPWAEGEVDYAPWGAKNAEIRYNYVGE